jgi:hypothetical protein
MGLRCIDPPQTNSNAFNSDLGPVANSCQEILPRSSVYILSILLDVLGDVTSRRSKKEQASSLG